MAINVDMKINRLPHARDKEVKGDILKETCYFFRLFIVKKAKLHRTKVLYRTHFKVHHFRCSNDYFAV